MRTIKTQTAWIRGLICVFAGRTCAKVPFLTLRLINIMYSPAKQGMIMYDRTFLYTYVIHAVSTFQFSICAKMCSSGLFLFVLRFYGPVNPMGLCRARSVYLTTRLLGRLSPLSG